MAGDESASFIAIIHIDGNSMGETVTNLMKNFRDYDEAIENIKDISKCIDYNYREAFKSAILSTINKMGINNNTLRIKPLIFDGDDITVACDAKLAFELAVSTLNEISNKEIRGNRMSACAGICIAKAHFPFSKAYKIAEEATTEAKKRSREYPGTSWLDYHINFSGLTGSLTDIREKWYQLNLGDESKPYTKTMFSLWSGIS